MAINLEQLKEYIAEDVLGHFLCDYTTDFEDCELMDKNGNEVLTMSFINKDDYCHYNLYTLFVDNPNNYENGNISARDTLDWTIWEPYEYKDDAELKQLMGDMFDSLLSTWTERLKLENK